MRHKAYYKAMRLKSRHARQRHTPWCNCPEMWQALTIGIKRAVQRGPLPAHVRVIRRDMLRFTHGLNPDE